MNSTGAGWRGLLASTIATSSGSRFPFRRLHRGPEGPEVPPQGAPAGRGGHLGVGRHPPAGRAAVDAAPAVTSEERAPRDLPLDEPRNADVVHEPDDVWPAKRVAGRA